MSLTRRKFLFSSGVTALSLSLGQLACTDASKVSVATRSAPTAVTPSAYGSWMDLYRERMTWDKVVKGTHHVNCWYQRGCTFNVYVKDGMVMREEQAATYEQTNEDVPDYNPRGCQKGCSYSDRMYDGSRISYPLKRVGERGSGQWKRVSWEDALDDIADSVVDAMQEGKSRSVYWDMGGGMTNGAAMIGLLRTIRMLDGTVLDIDSEVGDHHPGAAVTCGKISFASSADDMFYSDLIMIWGGNPMYTQIPNAHFITEARYNGAEIVAITPDLNASGVHCDLWVPVNVASDAAFGLSMSHVIIEEGLHNKAFIREQTDLCLLMDPARQQFLRSSDLKQDGADDEFYFFDLESQKIQMASKKTLELGEQKPALEGSYEVDTLNGRVTVTPVFVQLRESLKTYTPEAASKITGTPPKLIRAMARKIAKARSATILTQSNFGKFYHGMEMERAQLLVLALCGQYGKKGSGHNGFPILQVDGNVMVGMMPPPIPDMGSLFEFMGDRRPREDETEEMYYLRLMRKIHKSGHFMSSALLFHEHGGLAPLTGSARKWDKSLPREAQDYLEEAYEKGWQDRPPEPKVFFSAGGNILRRVRGGDRLKKGFLPKINMMVAFDWRMSSTAMHSDYVLPAAGWYERDDIVWATPISPFTQATVKAVEPFQESKSDWEFHYRLMEAVEKRSMARGKEEFVDHWGDTRSLDGVLSDFSYKGTISATDPEPLLKMSMKASSNIGDVSWEELKEKGYARHTGLGRNPIAITNACDIEPNETITCNTWHTNKKLPWPTLTRRMQFFIDHEIYLELGEQLPIHKDDPMIGGNYPLQMTGGHARWSIHSMWRDHKMMLHMQRGEPVMWLSPGDAAARSIVDGERVRVHNDIGDFEVIAKVAASTAPGQVIVYHAWEPFQFKNHKSHQSLTGTPFNPIQMAGGYFHLQQFMTMGQPGMNDRGTRVEVSKAKAA